MPMRKLRYSPICLPRVAAFIVWFNGEAPLFYCVCSPPDEAPPFGYVCRSRPPSMVEGTFSHCTGVIGPSTLCVCVHVGQKGHMRQYLLQQVVVDHCTGNVPVFGVGIEHRSGDVEGVQRDGMQGFCGPWPLSDLYPSTNEEVEPTAHHYSLCCHPLRHQPIAIQQATVPVPTKDALSTTYAVIQFPPRNPLADVLSIVSCFLSVTPHPNWYRGSFCKDRVGLIIAGIFEGVRARSCAPNKKQDVHLRLPSSLVILYPLTYLSSAFRPGLLLDEQCQISYTMPSLTLPVTHIGYSL